MRRKRKTRSRSSRRKRKRRRRKKRGKRRERGGRSREEKENTEEEEVGRKRWGLQRGGGVGVAADKETGIPPFKTKLSRPQLYDQTSPSAFSTKHIQEKRGGVPTGVQKCNRRSAERLKGQ